MPKYTVESPVKHDGTDYEIGSEIELSAKAARQLLEVGAIRQSAPASSTQPNPGPDDPIARLADITMAIGMLDKNDKTAWTKDGRPNTNALSELLGWIVNGAERDQAWADLNKPRE